MAWERWKAYVARGESCPDDLEEDAYTGAALTAAAMGVQISWET